MKRKGIILNIVVFLLATVGAFASAYQHANCYTKTTATCHLILCARTNIENMGACGDTNPKYADAACTIPAMMCWNVVQL